ncbi:MAG: glycosyltransferase family 39 protein [Chloroflexi bacterium]|nr:glycosyltransferase family 39 protein [Chloroflexota bacterium]
MTVGHTPDGAITRQGDGATQRRGDTETRRRGDPGSGRPVPPSPRPPVAGRRPVASATLLLAFGLRVYQLGFRGLIGDEAYSTLAGGGSLRALFAIYDSSEPHPPAHYLVLYGWERLAGASEFAVRFPSAAAGVLLVAVVWALGRRLLSPSGAALAAVLVAASPFLVVQSQLARGYALTAAALALAMLALVRVVDRPSPVLWIVYVGACALALYSHTFAALAIAALPLWYLQLPPSVRQRVGRRNWLAAHLLIGVLYLPWLVRVAALLRDPAPMWFEEGSLHALGWRVLRAFALGPASGSWAADASAGALLAVAAIGLVTVARAKAGYGSLVALTLLVPGALAVVLSLRAPILRDRYLLILFVPLALAVAAGISRLQRAVSSSVRPNPASPFPEREGGEWYSRLCGRSRDSLVVFASVWFTFVPSVLALPAYYRTVEFVSAAQMRELREFVHRAAGPDLTVVVNLDPADPLFHYYDLAPAETVYLPVASNERRQAGERALEELTKARPRVWLILFDYGPPEARYVEPLLNRLAYRLDERWFGHVRVVRYAGAATASRALQPLGATLRGDGAAITLVGYRLAADWLPSGASAGLTLVWRAEAAPGERFKVFVHLVDAAGERWAQNDAEPLAGRFPTTLWAPGQDIEDHYGILVPPGAPPGTYSLYVGLYRPTDGRRLGLPNGENALALGPLTVERRAMPASADEAGLRHRTSQMWDETLALLAYDLERPDGAAPTVVLRPGEELPVVLLWQARRAPGEYQVRLELRGTDGRAVAGVEGQPAGPTYPTGTWSPGETALGRHRLKVPTDAPLGTYTLVVSARPTGTGSWSPDRDRPLHQVRVVPP